MGLINKIFTAIRGGAREAGESIVNANSSRIVEQEIKDAEHALEQAKRDITNVMAKEMDAKREVERLDAIIKEHEAYVLAALEKNDEKLALEISERIASFNDELTVQKHAKEVFTSHTDKLKVVINKTEKVLEGMNRQLAIVKATDSVQKATIAITDNYVSSNSSLEKARESLNKIQAQQQNTDDRITAGETIQAELNGNDLEAKLKAIGIGTNTNSALDILAKIKAGNAPKEEIEVKKPKHI